MKRLFHLLSCLLWLPLLLSLAPAGAAYRPAGQSTVHPNIVLILTDDQDLTLGSIAYMPFLQSLLANQGLTFDNFFAPTPLCGPARATLLTGRYAHNTGIYNNTPPNGGFETFSANGQEADTFATALQAAGYRTALIGKYLNGYPMSDDLTYVAPGWDEWFVPASGGYSGLEFVINHNGTLEDYTTGNFYLTDTLSAQAAGFIAETAAMSPTVPFLAVITLYAPHEPAVPARRHRELFPDLQAPRTPSFNEADLRDKPPHIQEQPLLNEDDIAAIDVLYRRRIRSLQAVDEMLALLVRTLARGRQLDNTYILFTSDNGFHLGQHRFPMGKGRPYEEDIRVPLIIRGPGVPQGAVRTELVSLIDLAPTLAELAGTRLAVPADGRSLVSLLGEETPAVWRRAILAEHYPLATPSSYPDFVVIHTSDYKYIERGVYARELYDLRTDPYELNNRIRYASAAWQAQLSAWAAAYHACAGPTCRAADAQTPPALNLQLRQFLPAAPRAGPGFSTVENPSPEGQVFQRSRTQALRGFLSIRQ